MNSTRAAPRLRWIASSIATVSEPSSATWIVLAPSLAKVRDHPALSGLRSQPSDAHHLRFDQNRALGRKVSDEFTVPLGRLHHRETSDELTWWQHLNVNPLESGRGEQLIAARRLEPRPPSFRSFIASSLARNQD